MAAQSLSVNISSQLKDVAILIHGCHLKADEWEQIVFGEGNRLGRVPAGIAEAVDRKAKLIFWGTGASASDTGVKESEYTFNQTTGPKLKELASRLKIEPSELLAYLKKVSVVDTASQNTSEEIRAAADKCVEMGIKQLYLVSSPTHIARCLQEACKIKEASQDLPLTLYALPSETCYANSTASDVVILEPPHRGDLPSVPFHQTVQGVFPILRNAELAHSLNIAMASLIGEYKKKLALHQT